MVGLNRSLARVFFMADDNQLLFFGTAVTYLAYNYGHYVAFKLASMIFYPILIFTLTGNYKVMLLYCKWDKWQHLAYKLFETIWSYFFPGLWSICS